MCLLSFYGSFGFVINRKLLYQYRLSSERTLPKIKLIYLKIDKFCTRFTQTNQFYSLFHITTHSLFDLCFICTKMTHNSSHLVKPNTTHTFANSKFRYKTNSKIIHFKCDPSKYEKYQKIQSTTIAKMCFKRLKSNELDFFGVRTKSLRVLCWLF